MRIFSVILLVGVVLIHAQESKFVTNIKRITFNGTNAESYWNIDGTKFIFQAIRDGYKCDQIYSMNSDGSDIRMIGNGKGRTTCAFFLPGDKEFVYSSTMDTMGPGCPPTPDQRYGYVWPVYKTMAIYKASWPSGEIIQKMTDSGYYDAEATLNPKGDSIVFTSARDGDLELYSMNLNGTDVKRLTLTPGYDGGAFFSNDGSKIVWRANRPKGPALREYLDLLSLGLVAPVGLPMELFVMDQDGHNQKQITNLHASSFAPFFLPRDDGIIFASDGGVPGNRFNLYITNLKGDKLVKMTEIGSFNSFPMFSRDGKKLAWVSNRDAGSSWGGMDVYTADWIEIDWNTIPTFVPPGSSALNAPVWIILAINFVCVLFLLFCGLGTLFAVKRFYKS